jgi:hypothetical protein
MHSFYHLMCIYSDFPHLLKYPDLTSNLSASVTPFIKNWNSFTSFLQRILISSKSLFHQEKRELKRTRNTKCLLRTLVGPCGVAE